MALLKSGNATPEAGDARPLRLAQRQPGGGLKGANQPDALLQAGIQPIQEGRDRGRVVVVQRVKANLADAGLPQRQNCCESGGAGLARADRGRMVPIAWPRWGTARGCFPPVGAKRSTAGVTVAPPAEWATMKTLKMRKNTTDMQIIPDNGCLKKNLLSSLSFF